jgi:hypothetical protein
MNGHREYKVQEYAEYFSELELKLVFTSQNLLSLFDLGSDGANMCDVTKVTWLITLSGSHLSRRCEEDGRSPYSRGAAS